MIPDIFKTIGLLALTLVSALAWGWLFFHFFSEKAKKMSSGAAGRTVNRGFAEALSGDSEDSRGWGRGERIILSVGLGLGVVSYIFFTLLTAGALSRLSVFIFLCLPIPWCLLSGKKNNLFVSAPHSPPAGNHRSPLVIMSIGAISVLFLFNAAAAFVPPYAGDALGYHLPAPRSYLAARGFVWLEGNVLANQPAAVDLLFLIGFAGGSESYPQLLHCALGLGVAAAIYFFGRRCFAAPAAALAALIFYSVPSVSRISPWAQIDLGLAFWGTLMLFSALRWRERKWGADFSLAAVFAGLAMASKYTGILWFFILWAMLALDRPAGKKSLTRVALLGLLAAAVASPWYLKNLSLSGNPVYPFLYHLFGGRGWDAERAADYQSLLLGYGMGKTPVSFLLLPWNLAVKGAYDYAHFDGKIGPVFLAILPLMLFTGKKSSPFRFLGWYCALFFIFWAALSQQVRMLIPMLPAASLLAGQTAVTIWEHRPGRVRGALAVILLLALGTNAFEIMREWLAVAPCRFISGKESRESFLSRMVFNYPAVAFCNSALPKGSRVLFVYGGNGWYYSRLPTVVDSIFQDHTLKAMTRQSASPEELAARFRERGITHLLVNLDLTRAGLLPSLSSGERDVLERFLQAGVIPRFREGVNYVFKVR